MYRKKIEKTIIGILGDRNEAEDIGQETFIRFYKSIDKFRGESSVSTYITRIAINLSLDEIKRRKRKAMFIHNSNNELNNIPNTNNDNENIVNKELILQSIQNLHLRYRKVVVLRLIDGYSTKETAKILKLPAGTVLSRLSRAQEKVRKILTPYFDFRGQNE